MSANNGEWYVTLDTKRLAAIALLVALSLFSGFGYISSLQRFDPTKFVSAYAQQGEGKLTLNPTIGWAEDTVTVSGTGFTVSSVDIKWDNTTILASNVYVYGDGTFSASVTIPDSSAGIHKISAWRDSTCIEENFLLMTLTTSPDDGNYIYEYPLLPTSDAYPWDIAVDSLGNVWVTEWRGNILAKLNTTIGEITEYHFPYSNSGPTGIAIDSNNYVWVAEDAGRIARFIPSTETFTEYEVPTSDSRPFDIDIDSIGMIWFTEFGSNKIGKLNPSNGQFTEFSVSGTPRELAIDNNGVIWFTAQNGRELGRLFPDNGTTIYYEYSQASQPISLDIDSSGNIWFTEPGGFAPPCYLMKFSPSTTTFTAYKIPFRDNRLIVDELDNIWIANYYQPPGVRKFSPQTSIFTVYESEGPYTFCLTSDSSGNIWFVDQGGGGSSGYAGRIGVVTNFTTTLRIKVQNSEGTPLSGASVTIDSANVVEEGSGFYSLSGLTLGTYSVSVQKTGYNDTTSSITLDKFIDPDTHTLSIHEFDVVIDDSSVSDTRGDTGSTQTVSFHVSWEDGSELTEGIIYVNGTGYNLNSTGWVSHYVTSPSVGKQTWTVTGVNCSGVTDYIQTVSDPSIIWDRVVVQGYSVSDSRANVGDDVTIDVNLLYDYDGSAVLDGNVIINGLEASIQLPSIIDTIPVGDNPRRIGVNPSTNKIYIPMMGDNSVYVINGTTNVVVDIIAVGNWPMSAYVNPITNKVYVANFHDDDSTLTVINGSSDNIITNISVARNPISISGNPVTNKIYVSCPGADQVIVINGSSDTIIKIINLDGPANDIVVNPSSNKIYVPLYTLDQVTVINGSSDTIIASINVNDEPHRLNLNPQTNRIYVGSYSDGSLSIIDGETDTVSETISVNNVALSGIGINPTTNNIYVTSVSIDTIYVIDGHTNSIIKTFSTGAPSYIGVNPSSNNVYVANHQVTVINDVQSGVWSITDTKENAQTEYYHSVDVRANIHNITLVSNTPFSFDIEWISETDWPMFQYDSRHTSYSISNSPTTNNTIWELSGASGSQYSSPVISNDRIYVGNKVLNFTTGSLLWTTPNGGFSGTESAGSWAVVNDIALVALVYTREYSHESYGKLYAFNTSTGNEIWNYEAEDVISTSPVVYDGRVYFGDEDANHVISLNVTNGDELWTYLTSGWITGTLALSEGKVYVPTNSGVYCLDASDGEKIWEASIDARSAVAAKKGIIYFGSTGKVYALNATSGATIWTYTTEDWVYSSPAIAYDRVYIGSTDNKFYCFNASNGDLLWSYTTEYQVKSSPAIANNMVYFGSGDNKIYGLSAITGTLIWKYDTGGAVHTSPAIANGRVIVGNGAGRLFSFGPEVFIDSSRITSARSNVGTSQTVYLHASWDNGSDITGGDLYINGTGYAVNSTGWVSFQTSSSMVEQKAWTVTGVNCNGVTEYTQTVSNPSIIWDRIYCAAISVSDNRVNVGDNVDVDFSLKFEYDDTSLTDGVVMIEGGSASHQGSGVWRLTDSETNVTANTYDEFTTTDNTHSITEVNQNSQSETIIWDRVKVQGYSVSDSRVNVGGDVNVDVTLVYDYDGSVVTDGTVRVYEQWSSIFGGIGDAWGRSVKQTADGGFIVAGDIFYSYGAGMSDFYLVKTDSEGNIEWNSTFGGADYDRGYSVQETNDGGHIIAGKTRSYGAGDYDVYLVKTDFEGNLEWNRTYGGTDYDWGESVQETSDGGYIITGGTRSFGAGDFDVYLVKTDSDGDIQWNRTLGGQGYDRGYSVQETNDGGYIITGFTASFGAGNNDVYLVKTDSEGNMKWSNTFGGNGLDNGYSVQETGDGGYIVVGETESFGAGGKDVYVVKTDSEGNLEWSKFSGGEAHEYGWSVQETNDKGFIIAGITASFGAGNNDVYLVKTDSEGNQLWNRTLGGAGNDFGYSVQETGDGEYIIAGTTHSFGVGNADVYLVKTSNQVTASHQGNGVWRITESSDFVKSAIYNAVEVSGNTHGITDVDPNNQSAQAIWDQILVYYEAVDDGRVDIDGDIEYQVKAVLDFDDHPFGPEDSLTANVGIMTWEAENSWYGVNHSESIATLYQFQISSGIELTYGITAVSSNQSHPNGIWDRVEIYEKGASPSVLTVGGASTVWFKTRYEYALSEFNGTYGTLFVNGSAYTWNPTEERWENEIVLEEVGVYVYYVSSINETLYGLTQFFDSVGGMKVTYNPLPVVDIDSASVSDGRSNVNSTQKVSFHASWGNGSDVTSGSVYINGTDYPVNSTGWISFQTTSAVVVKETWTVTEVNCSRISSFVQNALDPIIIWDRIVVDGYFVSDSRVNVNDDVNVDVSIEYMYDDSAVTDGDVNINGVSASHQGAGVWRITDSEPTVVRNTYDTVAASDNAHGIFIVDQNNQSTPVIWDQIAVYWEMVNDSRVNVNSAIEYRVNAVLEYDESVLGSGDTVTSNTGSMSWDSENNWFEVSRAESSVGDYAFQVSSASEATYGITSLATNVSHPVGVWDRIVVYWEELNDSRVDVGDSIEWRVRAVLEYDNHVLSSSDAFSSSWGPLFWDESNERWNISHSEESVKGVTIGGWSGSEATYGITTVTENITETTGIWDQVQIISSGINSTELDLQTKHLLWVTAVYSYDNTSFTDSDGSLFINATECTWNNSRWELSIIQEDSGTRTYLVSSIDDATYGLSLFEDLVGSLSVERSGDWTVPLHVTLGESYSDVTFGVAENATRWFDEDYDDVIPPTPPSGIVAYLWHPENPSSPIDQRKLSTSIISIGYPETWTLLVDSIGMSGESTITWDSTAIQAIPENYSVMLETPTGNVNMRLKDSHTWTVKKNTIYSFSILISPQAVISIELITGWNMVSMQVTPFSPSVSFVLNEVSFYQVVTWTGSGYIPVSTFEPGRGYWVLVLEDVIVEVRGMSLDQVSLTLNRGWNMVGGPNGVVDADETFPGYYQLVTWDGYGYQVASSFEPGKGYWALVLDDTQIQLPSP